MPAEVFLLPDVGEGLADAEIVAWRIREGDPVEVNDVLVEIETAKSIVELPSPFAGVIACLHAREGDVVVVGAPLVSISALGVDDAIEDGPPAPAEEETDPPAERVAVLVGYGLAEGEYRSRLNGRRPAPASRPPRATPATWPVGRTAEEITDDELDALPRSDRRVPIRGVRKRTADAMVASAFTAPHVTEFLSVHMSRTMEVRRALGSRSAFADTPLTPLTFVAMAYLRALRRTPEANARWDADAGEIVQFADVNLGIAAATPRGLIVPNVKRAQTLRLRELAAAIRAVVLSARAGKADVGSLTGGTATITNVGVFGVDSGTPILNPGESTILAVGSVRRAPWVDGSGPEEFLAIRDVAQLSLSFDHRVIDGEQGSRILADTAAALTDPTLLLD